MQGNSKKLILIAIIIFFIVVTLSLVIIFHEETGQKITEREEEETVSEESLSEVEFTLYNQDKTIRWELTASRLNRRQEEGILELEPLMVDVYDQEREELLYQLTAYSGNYYNQEERLEIEGPLRLKRDNDYLQAARMTWRADEDIIYGYRQVEIETDSFVLTGSRFETNSDLTYFKIEGDREEQAHLIWREEEDD